MIGKGSFAEVYLMESLQFGFHVAMKIASKDMNFEEAENARHAAHPLVVDIYDVFECDDKKCIMMEFVDGISLLDLCNSSGGMDEDKARVFFIQLLIVMDFLHNKSNIVHRDMKLENVMVDKNQNIRLIDFGFSHLNDSLMKTFCGSVFYAAPELLNGEKYTESVDLWSLGVMLYALVTGQLPFNGNSAPIVAFNVKNTEPFFPSFLSSNVVDLIQGMLKKDGSKRLTIDEIKQHPWLKCDSMQRGLTIYYDIINCFHPCLDDVKYQLTMMGVGMENEESNTSPSLSSILYRIVYRNNLVESMSDFNMMLIEIISAHRMNQSGIQTQANSVSFTSSSFQLPGRRLREKGRRLSFDVGPDKVKLRTRKTRTYTFG